MDLVDTAAFSYVVPRLLYPACHPSTPTRGVDWLGGRFRYPRAASGPGMFMKHCALACWGLLAVALSCAIRATSFVCPLAGRAVSPSVHSSKNVARAGHVTGFASQWRRRPMHSSRIRMSMSSETAEDEEPATGGGALPQTDASPERKEEILAVLSAVIDPGEKVA